MQPAAARIDENALRLLAGADGTPATSVFLTVARRLGFISFEFVELSPAGMYIGVARIASIRATREKLSM